MPDLRLRMHDSKERGRHGASRCSGSIRSHGRPSSQEDLPRSLSHGSTWSRRCACDWRCQGPGARMNILKSACATASSSMATTSIRKAWPSWNSAETLGQPSKQFFRNLLQQLADGPPFERSIGNVARMVIAVAEYPGFRL